MWNHLQGLPIQKQKRVLLGILIPLVSVLICAYLCCMWSIGGARVLFIRLAQPWEPWPIEKTAEWQTDFDDVIVSAPFATDGQVYVETLNELVSLDASTGIPKWKRFFDFSNAQANIAVGDEFLAVGTETNALALRKDTGEMIWQYASLNGVNALLIDQNILFVSNYSEILAVSLPDGKELWHSTEPGGEHNPPLMILSEQHLLVIQAAGRVYSLNAQNGQTEWKRDFDDTVYDHRLANKDEMLVSGRKSIYKINVTNGEVLWQTPLPKTTSMADMAITDTLMFWDTFYGSISAASQQDGKLLWTVDTGAESICPPLAVYGENLWVRVDSLFSTLVEYQAETGEIVAKHPFKTPAYQIVAPCIGPVIKDDNLFLVSGNRIAMYSLVKP